MARLRTATALSSSLYIRNRLPQPKARIETFAPVLPNVREGSVALAVSARACSFASSKLALAAAPTPRFSRNSLREMSLLIAPPSSSSLYFKMIPRVFVQRRHQRVNMKTAHVAWVVAHRLSRHSLRIALRLFGSDAGL